MFTISGGGFSASLNQTAMIGRVAIVVDRDDHTRSAFLLCGELSLSRIDLVQSGLDLINALFAFLRILSGQIADRWNRARSGACQLRPRGPRRARPVPAGAGHISA